MSPETRILCWFRFGRWKPRSAAFCWPWAFRYQRPTTTANCAVIVATNNWFGRSRTSRGPEIEEDSPKMPQSPLRLVMRSGEFIPKEKLKDLPRGLRGIYVLYNSEPNPRNPKRPKYNVLYVGMASVGRRGGIRGRLFSHSRSKRKGSEWSHFSVFEVWDNIRDEEVVELEGLFRHIYRRDATANRLNIQRSYRPLRNVRVIALKQWSKSGRTITGKAT